MQFTKMQHQLILVWHEILQEMPDSAPGTDWDRLMLDASINMKRSVWRAALQEGIWGSGLQQLSVNQECVLAAKRKNCILVHQTQHHQPVKGGDYPTVYSFGATSSSPQCAVLGPTI